MLCICNNVNVHIIDNYIDIEEKLSYDKEKNFH